MTLDKTALDAAAQLVDPSGAFNTTWQECQERARAIVTAYLSALTVPENVGKVVAELRRGVEIYRSGGTRIYSGPSVRDLNTADLIEALSARLASERAEGVREGIEKAAKVSCSGCANRPSPSLTASLDAAIALVEQSGEDITVLLPEALEWLFATGYRTDEPFAPQVARALLVCFFGALEAGNG